MMRITNSVTPSTTKQDDDKGKDVATAALIRVKNARTNMALLHFIMTSPKWSISLFLFLAARQIPILTPHEAIQRPMQRLQIAFKMESESYQQCALDSAMVLQDELHMAAQTENDRLDWIRQRNQQAIVEGTQRKDTCFQAAKNALDVLSQWQDHVQTMEWVQDDQICSHDKREYLHSLLGGQVRLVEDEVASVWEQQLQDSLRGFQLIQDYAEARFKYDYNYFVGLRIQPALELIGNLTNIQFPELSIDTLGIEQRIRDTLSQLVEALHQAQVHIQALKAKLAEVTKSFEAMYLAYKDVYDRLLKGLLFVQDILPPGVPLPEFWDIQGLPLADSLLPLFGDVRLDLDLDIASTLLLLDNTARLCVDILKEVIMDLKAQSDRFLRGAIRSLSEALSSILVLEDYNPPSFVGTGGTISTLSDEVALQQRMGATALNETKRLMARLASLDFPGDGLKDWNATIETNVGSAASEESTIFSYLRPIFPSLLFPKIVSVLLTVGSATTWIVEVVIQAFRLWKLEASYTRQAIPDLPEVSYVKDDDSDDKKQERPEGRQVMLSMILKNVLVPRMFLAIILLPMVLVLISMWYPHIKRNCQDTRDGTFLANRFIAPILVNEANALGNAYFLKTEMQCRKTRREICQQMQSQALVEYQLDHNLFSNIEAEYERSIEILEIMKDCVPKEFHQTMEESCCGLKGHASCSNSSTPGFCPTDSSGKFEIAFRPLKNYLLEPGCDPTRPFPVLTEPNVECEELLQICENIPCDGVDKSSLRAETVETDCEVELYGIRLFFFVLLALYHAVTVNLASTLLFKGIRNVCWRGLCPDEIPFQSLMREDGSLARGSDQEDRARRISIAMSRYEAAGKVQIIAGGFVLLVWGALIFC